MKLNKKEVRIVRHQAYLINAFGHPKEKLIQEMKAILPERKFGLADQYLNYLTSREGVKSFVVDFSATGEGRMTIHNVTAEEAKEKALYQLQNGAFGRKEELQNITICDAYPDSIFHNKYDDYLERIA